VCASACRCADDVTSAVSHRYLVDSHWFKQWKKYVGFDSWDKYQMGEQSVYPGPVDNRGLLKGEYNSFGNKTSIIKYDLHFAVNNDGALSSEHNNT